MVKNNCFGYLVPLSIKTEHERSVMLGNLTVECYIRMRSGSGLKLKDAR